MYVDHEMPGNIVQARDTQFAINNLQFSFGEDPILKLLYSESLVLKDVYFIFLSRRLEKTRHRAAKLTAYKS